VFNAKNIFLDSVNVSNAADFALYPQQPPAQKHDLTLSILSLRSTACKKAKESA
jgi:hypothetical protein